MAAPGALSGAGEAGEANRAFSEEAVTAADIERFTVAEGLSDVERAQLYLGGPEVQQLAVIQNLAGLVRAAGRGAWTALSRGLAEVARSLDADGQHMAAAAFSTLARERLLPPVDITDVILPMALAGVVDPASHASLQAAWLTCLGEVCAAVEPSTVHTRVLPLIVTRTGAGRGLRERCHGCEVLGAVAPHVGADDLQRTLLRLATSLCMDTEWQVRHAACQQLPTLAGAAVSKLEAAALSGLLEDVFALLEDEEALVRATAWRAATAVLDLIPPEQRRTRLLPLLLAQCHDLDPHAEVQRSVAAGFGALMGKLVPDMDGDPEVHACLGCFRSLAWRHDHATRLACAAGFAAVLRAGTARRYGSHLHDTLLRLASDGDGEVRLAMAGCMHDVAATLGRDRCCQYLRQPVAVLLQDERQEVQAELLRRLPQVLEHFAPARPAAAAAQSTTAAAAAAAAAAEEQRGKTFAPFVEPLLRLEAVSGYSWRLQLALLHAMAAFPAFFTGDQLYDRLLPLALKYMAEGAAAVRAGAAAAAAAIWRALRRPAHRTSLYSRLIHDYGQSKCFRQRMAFIDFCRHAQQHFSSKFVKAYLLEPALTLAYDPVANVRLHLAAALPALKQAVALPDDVHLLERLNSAMSHLITDGDGDVCQAARKANEEFKRMPVRMSCGALESSPAEVKAFEAADAARAEGERDFVFDTDALDKVHADIVSYDEQLRPVNPRLALLLPPLCRVNSMESNSSSKGGSSRGRPGAATTGASGSPKARGGLAAVAAAHRSSSDSQEARREKGAASSQHTRTASAGAVGSPDATGSGGGVSKVPGIGGSRAAPGGRLKVVTASAAVRSSSSSGHTAHEVDKGGGAAADECGGQGSGSPHGAQRGSGGVSRLSRGTTSAASKAAAHSSPTVAAPAAVTAAAAAPKLSRPSPTAASRRLPLATPPAQGLAASPPPPLPSAHQQSSLPERLAAAAAAAGAAGRSHGGSPTGLPSAHVSRIPASKLAPPGRPDVGHLASKLKAALHIASPGVEPQQPSSQAASHSSGKVGAHGSNSSSGSSGGSRHLSVEATKAGGAAPGVRPAGRASSQHSIK